jgi:hypothetical protein
MKWRRFHATDIAKLGAINKANTHGTDCFGEGYHLGSLQFF